MFSTTQTTEASRCGLEQMQHVSVSDIMAYLAIFHFMLQRHDGIAERFHHCRILAEQVKNQPHSRLASHSGQLGKLIYRLLQ